MAEVDRPVLSGGDLLVEMHACGLCGSDVEKVKGHYAATGKIGHEPAGTVVEVGSGVTGYRVGDRVFVHHHVPCYNCDVCRAGRYTFCPTYQKTNLDPGGFAEFFRVPPENVSRGAALVLPDHVSFEEAALIEPLGCCIDALAALPFQPGDRVLMLGLGPIGLLYLKLLRVSGAGLAVGADLSAYRREVALREGADRVFDPRAPEGVTEGEFDLVVVATGAVRAISDGFRWVRRGGTVNLFGLPEKGSHLETDLQDLYMKGARLVPTYAATERGTNTALRLIASGRLPVRQLVTHRIPLARIEEGFRQATATEGTIKVVITSGAPTA